MDSASFKEAVLDAANFLEPNIVIGEEDVLYQIEINKPKPIAVPTFAKQALQLGKYRYAYN
ncbi:hypothetical protein N9093_01780 [bacterium]|nr:hypothetical protein [bacterium]